MAIGKAGVTISDTPLTSWEQELQILKRALRFLIDGLPEVLTILIAAGVVWKYRVAPATLADLPLLVHAILAILVLLAISGLLDRSRRLRRIQELTERTNSMVEARFQKNTVVTEVLGSPDDPVDIDTAHDIRIGGVVLGRTIRVYSGKLRERIMQGASVRIMMVDPMDKLLSEQFALRSPLAETDATFWQTRLSQSHQVIRSIASGIPEAAGRLEIGLLPFIPGFGLFLADPHDSDGVCIVKIYPHLTDAQEPVLTLRRTTDPYWYPFFVNQFESLWEKCRVERYPVAFTRKAVGTIDDVGCD